MKRKFALRAFGLFAILLAFGLARAQSSQPAGPSKNTSSGKTSLEAVKGDDAKQQWIKTHPEEYKKMVGKVQNTQPTVTPYGAAENKEAWIQSHPEEYAKMVGTQKSTPSTGKVAIVEKVAAPQPQKTEMTEAQKKAWIANHPSDYAKMGGTTKVANAQPASTEMTEAQKKAWIVDHPAEYAKVANRTEATAAPTFNDTRIHVSRQDYNALPAERQRAMTQSGNYIIVDRPITR